MFELRRYLFQSFGIHFSIAFILLFFPKIYEFVMNKPFIGENKIIPQALRVDMVGMPTMTVKELENLPKLQGKKIKVEKPRPLPKEVVKEEVVKKVDDEAIAIGKKKNSKKSKKKKKGAVAKKINKQAADELKNLILMGNKVSKGELAVGDVSDVDLSEFEKYALNVKEKIRLFWKLPSFLIDLDLRSRVRLFINSSGKVIRYSFIEKSGNKEYDRRVRQAIEYAAPFEKPDNKIVEALESGSLVLVFPF